MASILSGFEYDIFISYRHNDNLDGWVTDFVQNLEKELRGTLKDAVTVYFDKNPHDGLLETHNVDKSLEGKLKCLIFIPIISQTYCDPKSFAWLHEFVAFNKLAQENQLGRDIKLSNGNVASRILPVKIHELDAEDKATIENEIGGMLRAIEFIYKEAGVNRPLKSTDSKADNQNRTDYRNQVNKVANAIKESIQAMKSPASKPSVNLNQVLPSGNKATRSFGKKATWIAVGLMILFALIYAVSQYMDSSETKTRDKSIAVLPFVNMSNDPEQDYFSNGVMEEILTHLFKIGDLRVTSRTSVMGYKGTTKNMIEIGNELQVDHILEGSVQKYGDKVRITVQLIDASNDNHIWAERYDRELKDVFSIQSEVAMQIANALKANLSPELQQRLESNPTTNTEAYDLVLKGREQVGLYYSTFDLAHIDQGLSYFNEAVKLDSNYSNAYAGLARANWVLGQFSPKAGKKFWENAKKFAMKAISLDPNNGLAYAELSEVQFKWEWNKLAAMESLQKAIALAPGDLGVRSDAVYVFQRTNDCARLESESEILNSISPSEGSISDYFIPLCRNNIDQIRKLEAKNYGNHAPAILIHQEKYEECIELLTDQINNQGYSFMSNAILGEAYALAGNSKLAESIVYELNEQSKQRFVSKTSFAAIYFALGNEDKAFEMLEVALKENDPYIHVMMEFYASIYRAKDDPRMASIIERSWIPRKM